MPFGDRLFSWRWEHAAKVLVRTPVHLDIHVGDIDQGIERAVAACGKLEAKPKPSFANLVDPSGNGVDIV